MRASFIGYGPYGRSYHDYWTARWSKVLTWWGSEDAIRARAGAGIPDLTFDQAVTRFHTPEYLLFTPFLTVVNRCGGVSALRQLENRLWTPLRSSWTPALRSTLEIQREPNAQLDIGRALVARWLRSGKEDPLTGNFARIAYAWFTADQVDYLLADPNGLVEVGCGAGYFMAMFRQLTGNGVACDTNSQKLTDGSECSREYIDALRKESAFFDANGPEFAALRATRSLGLFWPEPGSDMFHRTLAAYRGAGGERVYWKIGATFGSGQDKDGKSVFHADYVANVIQGFEELGRYWEVDARPGVPTWDPFLEAHSMVVLKRK